MEEDEVDALFQAKGVEVVEVGDARIGEHDDLHALAAPRRRQAEGIFGRQPMGRLEERQLPERGPPGTSFDFFHAVREQGGIAAEAVDDEAHDHRGIGRIDHRLRADEAGDHATTIDVAQQHDRHVGGAREAHVGDVGGPQVHLGRRARAFDQHEVRLGREDAEALQHGAEQLRLHRLVLARLGIADDPPLHHDLRADLALGLQQHRVHVHAERHPRERVLCRACAPANLAAICGNGGIIRTYLRF